MTQQVTALKLLAIGMADLHDMEFNQENPQQRVEDSFRRIFGLSSDTCTRLWNDLVSARKTKKSGPHFFLLTMLWLKSYRTELDLAISYQQDETTLRKYFWFYVEGVQSLKEKKILQDWQDPNDNAMFIMSVDGTHCPIGEPHQFPSAKWYSHKYNSPGLTYELGIRLYGNQLAWINGPFPAGEHDITVFRKPNGLKSKIPVGKLVIADKGYLGEGDVVSVRNEFDSDKVKKFKKRVRARHESFNGRLKEYKILSTRFRSSVKKHKKVFEAICVICQYDIEGSRPLFEI